MVVEDYMEQTQVEQTQVEQTHLEKITTIAESSPSKDMECYGVTQTQ